MTPMRGRYEEELFRAREEHEGVRTRIGALIQRTLKSVFETKHQYQSTRVDLSSLLTDAPGLKAEIERFAAGPWQIGDSERREYLRPLAEGFTTETIKVFGPLGFSPPEGIKIFCTFCGEREAFNPMQVGEVSRLERFVDLDQELRPPTEAALTIQVFMLAYLCQRCKETPEVFLVRREDLKLTLCGRAPMEHVETPREIPREVKKWYRDALIAFQSGKTLAGLLYLRTVIEQWARRVTGSKVPNGDQLLAAYMESLPRVMTDNFTSMREVYARLSAQLHAAVDDAALFEEARGDVHQHFLARDLHKRQVEEHFKAYLERRAEDRGEGAVAETPTGAETQ